MIGLRKRARHGSGPAIGEVSGCPWARQGYLDRYRETLHHDKIFSLPVRSPIASMRLLPLMGLSGDVSRSLLLDPEYWQPRLERLRRQPRQLAIFPRPDLGRPGIEVVELRLRGHDATPLHALLARSAFACAGLRVCLRACADLASPNLDWTFVEQGGSDLVFCHPVGRRLEDRVLDLLRVIDAACSMESVAGREVSLQPLGSCIQDEFTIVEHIRSQGWVDQAPES